VWNQAQQEVGFGIVYLDDMQVRWGSGIELPNGSADDTLTYPSATWSLYR
jgi:hypothetical protein